jgi:GT2 family glycosyltransferase
MTAWGCVVLTAGRRPGELALALASLLAQRDVELDVAVVGNGWEPSGLPDGVRGVHEVVDRGIPAGRNAGVPQVSGELLFFLDDDARLASPDTLASLARAFGEDPSLGAVQLRVDASDGRPPLREWHPRLRGDRLRTGEITALWEGAVAIRRSVFEAVGGWPEAFRFVHEGADLAWRVMDAGHRVVYRGDLACLHPTPDPDAPPARHGYSHYFGARNRVWLARRHLPAPLAVAFVASFALRTLPRMRSADDVRRALRGYRAGLRDDPGPRRTLRARTLWRMTRAGRPPVI